jgi:lysophospholipase L1-like esterase
MTQKHICLMGDSIFDNDGYVPGEPGVIEQLRRSLPQSWSASKVAVDGDRITHIAEQLENVPTHTTHIVVSIGGNDLRTFGHLLREITQDTRLEQLIATPLAEFEASYGAMLDKLLQHGLPVTVCTIYTAIPFEDPAMQAFAPNTIGAFNARILRQAETHNLSVIRLDQICTDPQDFSKVSPIEPSAQGGEKIVDAILSALN